MPTSAARPLDLAQDVGARRSDHRRRGPDAGILTRPRPAPPAGLRRHPRGCAPRYSGLMKLLSRCAGSTRGRPGRARLPRQAHLLAAHAGSVVRRARDRRRAERRDAVPRQPRGNRRDRAAARRACRRRRRRARARRRSPGRCSGRGRRTAAPGDARRRTPPARTSTMRSPSMTSVPGDRIRSGSTSSAPDSTIIGLAQDGAASRLSRGPSRCGRAACGRSSGSGAGSGRLAGLEERAIDRGRAAATSWRSSGALMTSTPPLSSGGNRAVVEVVAIERDERAAQLPRQPVVLHVGRAPQVVVLEHEQHVPAAARRA